MYWEGWTVQRTEGILALTVSQKVGTLFPFFTFDSALLTSAGVTNAATSGGAIATVRGMNFANTDRTVSSQLGSTACATTSWTSQSQLRCFVSAGTGASYGVAVAVAKVVGSSLSVFSYDGPVVTRLPIRNGPPSSGQTLTMYGMNFGVTDASVSAKVGSTDCRTTSWLSSSVMTCQSAAAVRLEASVPLYVVVDTLSATLFATFSYDSPVVTYASTFNQLVTGPGLITITGSNFLPVDTTVSAAVNMVACVSTSWLTSTAIQCLFTQDINYGATYTVMVGDFAGTFSTRYAYDSSFISPAPTPSPTRIPTPTPTSSPTSSPTPTPSSPLTSSPSPAPSFAGLAPATPTTVPNPSGTFSLYCLWVVLAGLGCSQCVDASTGTSSPLALISTSVPGTVTSSPLPSTGNTIFITLSGDLPSLLQVDRDMLKERIALFYGIVSSQINVLFLSGTIIVVVQLPSYITDSGVRSLTDAISSGVFQTGLEGRFNVLSVSNTGDVT
jgi:hypothetical protein